MRFRSRRDACVAVVLLAVAMTGCGRSEPKKVPEGGSAFGAKSPARHRSGSLLDALAPLIGSEGVQRHARKIVLPLPLDRAAAQLFLVGFEGTRPRAPFFQRLLVRDWGGVVLERGNYVEPGQLAALAGEVAAVARNAGHRVPLVAAAQLGGQDSAFPNLPPRSQAQVTSAREARAQALLAGRQLRALGIEMTFAPDADLGSVGGPWEGRGFSDEPRAVSHLVRAAVAGYRAAGVAAAPGHFPGEGAASQDPGEGAASVGLALDDLRAHDLRPFAAVAHTAPAIAMSDSLYAALDGVTPATLLPAAVAMLRHTGFRGVIVSGDLASVTLATGGSVADAAVEALAAGCDLLYIPGGPADQEAAWRAVVRAVRSGRLPVARIRSALERVTALKRRLGVASTTSP